MTMTRLLTHPNKAGVSIAVVKIVKAVLVSCKALHYELDSSRSICCEYDIPLAWVCAE